MPNYKAIAEYDGTRYSGWQRQKNANSVQSEIENSFNILLKKPVQIIGAGRTDSGVHALNQVFNFKLENEIDIDKTLKSVNAILPDDISIKKIEMVDDNFHSRFSASGRVYKYYVINRKDIFHQKYAWYLPWKINFERLKEVETLFLGRHYFRAFCKAPNEVDNFNCFVFRSIWDLEEDYYVYTIEADRFIHGMVRGIVGCMIEYNYEKISLNEIENLINFENNSVNPKWAPPKGLFLSEVKY